MKKILHTTAAPAAVGPYSQGVFAGNLLMLSGQIALLPNGESKTDESVETQTTVIMENITSLCRAANLSLNDIVKTTIYLTDIGDFAAVNAVYGKYFAIDPPARSCVAVLSLPKGAKVEIECVVLCG